MRYLPLTGADRAGMLAAVGASSVDELFRDVPAAARLPGPVDLPRHLGEWEVEQAIGAMAEKNRHSGRLASFLGAGAYRHHIPAAVDHLIQRSEFLTSYTPYQPEIAQGTLQYLFEFQTQVALLTGMEVANASMYDGSTACGEAVEMARRITGRGRVVLSGNLHPHYAAVVKTLGALHETEIVQGAPAPAGEADLAPALDTETACVVVQYPDVFGHVRDWSALAGAAQAAGALLIVVVTEVVSLGALVPPGAMGADIVVGEGQGLGVGLQYGGPYLGLFAARQKYVRQMPGRLCGETVDAEGRRGFVLTLSTREQHIRREKATSNICTNSGLCSLAFSIHLSLLGEAGLTHLAALNHARAVQAAEALAAIPGVTLATDAFFNEFTLKLDRDAAAVVEALVERGVLAGVPGARLWPGDAALAGHLLVAVTETNTPAEIDAFAAALREVLA
ncbi:aminomethyl-transferring glycine dehydrogenase subunit GcvPA [Zavarzinia compransoris]|uniref:Probable glycine dehydrogenase (decarboxylating) subunit 1 n=1 Tax=Zavarzinia compransoris TaxID=1264899 RepID=A0A317EAR1_9PROT|nr:aminomethyl-transferring glycine dehydrogenase subunit GcvPA [Zavarzinia compransoris]PWR23316.1 aminomethyl-transferring glycine dehydrogenase subunit GcvPA [Zavarzinia compransoris]TDP46112.1 glycine dehydrogenase (decarboxylating) alpha subunit [Zavarzinia compransoris]